MKNRLMTPGPVIVPPEALLAMAKPIIHHRTEEFENMMTEVREGLKYVFQTKNEVFILSSSSTGAMESSIVNLLSPGDKVLVIGGGKFGERWAELCEAYSIDFHYIDVEWGKAVEIQRVADELSRDPSIKCVYATLCETSTGVVHDIEGLGKIVSKTNSLLVVDAVSGLGAVDIQTDNWNIDVVVSGSQKGLMIPPGLAFITLNQRAWSAVEKAKLPRYYFDLKKAKKSCEKNQTPFTCSVSLLIGLRETLNLIKNEGIENTLNRHAKFAQATRAGVKALGLELYAPDSPANNVTAVKVPEGLDGEKLVDFISEKYGITFAGGQDKLKGKVFRIAHIGYIDNMDIISAISSLEMALPVFGHNVPAGAGVRAAEEVFLEYNS